MRSCLSSAVWVRAYRGNAYSDYGNRNLSYRYRGSYRSRSVASRSYDENSRSVKVNDFSFIEHVRHFDDC